MIVCYQNVYTGNSVVWSRCPNNVLVYKREHCRLESTLLSCIIMTVNMDCLMYWNIFGFPESFTVEKSVKRDKSRVARLTAKSTQKVKKRRKNLWSIKKGYADEEKAK